MGTFLNSFSYHIMKAKYQLLKGKEKLVLGRSNILFKRVSDRHVVLKVQTQGLKSSYLKNLFAM
jgi:hypothetical protein